MAEIQRGAFRPTASPRDTVAVQTRFTDGVAPLAPVRPLAPEAPAMPRPPKQGPSALAQLGEALQGLNPRINTALDQHYQRQNAEAGLEAELRAMRDNMTSWAEAVKADPTLADRSPYFRQVYEGRAARTLVQRRSGELLAEYYSSPIAGSDDPGAINQWLTERMQSTIDTAESPAQRMAMIEEVQKLSGQFISAHRENAVRNLLQNNVDSLGSGIGVAIDNYSAQGGSYGGAANVVGKGQIGSLQEVRDKLMGRGLSKQVASAIAGNYFAESAFNTAAVGDNGTSFGLAQWRDPTPGKGRRTNLINFASSRGMDAASLDAQIDFTMHELEKDYPGLVARMEGAGSVEQAARIFTDVFERPNPKFAHHDRRGAAARQAYALGGDAVAANPKLGALTGEIHEMEAQGRLQGMNPRQINELSIQAVTMKMLQHDDETLGDVLLQPRPDGTPGAGMTLAGQQAIEQAKQQVLNARTQRQNAEFTRQERERKESIRAYKGLAMEGLMDQIMQGQSPALDPKLIRDAAAIDADLADELLAVQRNLDSYDKTEDRNEVNHVAHGVMSGALGVDDVFLAVRDGKLKDPTTIRNLYDDARRNDNGGFTQDPIFKKALTDIESLVGEPLGGGALNSPEQAVQAQMMLRRSFMAFMEDNPRASEGQKIAFLDGELSAITKRFKPHTEFDDWAEGDPQGGNVDEAALPLPSPAARQPAARNVVPKSDFNWRTWPVYADSATLEAEVAAWAAGDTNNTFSRWVEALRFTNPEQLAAFIETQRTLLQNTE